jgi:uncharacterized protein
VRRVGVLLVTALGLLALLTGCQRDFTGLHLRIAAGSKDGVYYPLGMELAKAWTGDLGLDRQPSVQVTDGAVDNVQRLLAGQADVVFADADTVDSPAPGGVRALARIYEDYLQVVVRADSPVRQVSGLRGLRVSVGAQQSQTAVVANRVLGVAGVAQQVQTQYLDLDDSLAALKAGQLDAFFWSGGLPTSGISELGGTTPVRLVSLADVLPQVEAKYPVYQTAEVPTTTYRGMSGEPVATLSVPNYLLVSAGMPDDEAEALVRGLFGAEDALVRVNPAARSIDEGSAIYTSPVPLHPGALAYYRSVKV